MWNILWPDINDMWKLLDWRAVWHHNQNICETSCLCYSENRGYISIYKIYNENNTCEGYSRSQPNNYLVVLKKLQNYQSNQLFEHFSILNIALLYLLWLYVNTFCRMLSIWKLESPPLTHFTFGSVWPRCNWDNFCLYKSNTNTEGKRKEWMPKREYRIIMFSFERTWKYSRMLTHKHAEHLFLSLLHTYTHWLYSTWCDLQWRQRICIYPDVCIPQCLPPER